MFIFSILQSSMADHRHTHDSIAVNMFDSWNFLRCVCLPSAINMPLPLFIKQARFRNDCCDASSESLAAAS